MNIGFGSRQNNLMTHGHSINLVKGSTTGGNSPPVGKEFKGFRRQKYSRNDVMVEEI